MQRTCRVEREKKRYKNTITINKIKVFKRKIPDMTLGDNEPSKTPLSVLSGDHLQLAVKPTLKSKCSPVRLPCRRQSIFCKLYKLEITSGLGLGACVYFSSYL